MPSQIININVIVLIMKKLFLLVLCAVMTAVCAKAQLYVGGAIGFDYFADKSSYGSTTSKGDAGFIVNFSPMLGFDLSEKMSFGAKIHLSAYNFSDRESDPTKSNALGYGLSPYIRYAALSVGNFSLLIEPSIFFLGATTKETYGTTSHEGPKLLGYGLQIGPVLTYNLTNRLSLEANVNFLRFSFGQIAAKYGSGDSESKFTTTLFGIGINPTSEMINISSEINEVGVGLQTTSPLQIGLTFRF